MLQARPVSITCDRFRVAELQDAVAARCAVLPRGQRWSEASEDIRSLRRQALDGPLSIEPKSRHILMASLAASTVESDAQGSLRMIKSSSTNTGRDDVVVAWVNCAGARDRVPAQSGLRRSLARMNLPRYWDRIRRAAKERAGYRSSRSGLAGRLEVHHIDGDRSNNAAENLEVLTRGRTHCPSLPSGPRSLGLETLPGEFDMKKSVTAVMRPPRFPTGSRCWTGSKPGRPLRTPSWPISRPRERRSTKDTGMPRTQKNGKRPRTVVIPMTSAGNRKHANV